MVHSSKKRILIIEDESGIADTITYSLETEGFCTKWVATGIEGLRALTEGSPSLIVLDIGLPDINGFDLVRKIRELSDVPVVFLTARGDEIDRILGFELGGDDYIVKPFSPRELTARIKAIFRRVETESEGEDEKVFSIDYNRRSIRYFGKPLVLTRYEYELLLLLISRPGWVFSREKIMEMVWVDPEESFDRTVDTHIKSIRGKLRDIRDDYEAIVTHRGVGYSMREDI
jgi:two-component system catabolic regulation response regulator CreB